jgi:uncharacterized protein (TIGR00251 family)
MEPSSTYLRLCVIPGSGKPGVFGRYGEAWKLRVTAPPERGKANEATLTMLADILGLAASNLRLVSGHGSRDKTVEVAGLTTAEAERRLTQ